MSPLSYIGSISYKKDNLCTQYMMYLLNIWSSLSLVEFSFKFWQECRQCGSSLRVAPNDHSLSIESNHWGHPSQGKYKVNWAMSCVASFNFFLFWFDVVMRLVLYKYLRLKPILLNNIFLILIF